jgi:type III restriction enzyme
MRRFDPIGSTDGVRFVTRKVVLEPPPEKSHLNHVVLDGVRGNSWEEGLANVLEGDRRVNAYVKNERLGFTIPYVYAGQTHEYVPDFLVRLVTEADDVERTLIVEVSGSRKSPARPPRRPTRRATSGARP